FADPCQVVLPERGARDDPEPILGEPRDGEVAFDPAPPVQHLRVRDRADVAPNAVVAEVLEECSAAFAGDLDLRERRLIENGGCLATRAVLPADRRRPQPARPTARAQRLVPARRVGLEPVRTLPAGLLAERRSEL